MRDLVNVPAAGQPRAAKPLSGRNATTEPWEVISSHFKGQWAASKVLLFAYYASNEGTDPNVHSFAPCLAPPASSSRRQHCQRSLRPCLPLACLAPQSLPVACPLPSHRGGHGRHPRPGAGGAGTPPPPSMSTAGLPEFMGAMTSFLLSGGGAVPYDQDS